MRKAASSEMKFVYLGPQRLLPKTENGNIHPAGRTALADSSRISRILVPYRAVKLGKALSRILDSLLFPCTRIDKERRLSNGEASPQYQNVNMQDR